MTLDEAKIEEMYWLFMKILPINSPKYQEKIKQGLKFNIVPLLPEIFGLLSQYSNLNKQTFEMYLEFLNEAIQYMKGNRDNWPETEQTEFELRELYLKEKGISGNRVIKQKSPEA